MLISLFRLIFWGTIIYVIYRLFKFRKANELRVNQTHSNDSFSSEEKNSVAYVKWIIANAGAKFMTAMIWSSIGIVINLLCTLISATSMDLDVIQVASVIGGIATLIFTTASFINFWNASKLMRNI
jgi:hypothetical protein